MANVTFSLHDGLPFGKGEEQELLKETVVRELTAGDLIDARMESERVIQTGEGPRLVSSPELLALHCLRRQIVSIGKVKGPMSLANLRTLSLIDLREIESQADTLEAAVLAERLGQRGRADTAPGDSGAGLPGAVITSSPVA